MVTMLIEVYQEKKSEKPSQVHLQALDRVIKTSESWGKMNRAYMILKLCLHNRKKFDYIGLSFHCFLWNRLNMS